MKQINIKIDSNNNVEIQNLDSDTLDNLLTCLYLYNVARVSEYKADLVFNNTSKSNLIYCLNQKNEIRGFQEALNSARHQQNQFFNVGDNIELYWNDFLDGDNQIKLFLEKLSNIEETSPEELDYFLTNIIKHIGYIKKDGYKNAMLEHARKIQFMMSEIVEKIEKLPDSFTRDFNNYEKNILDLIG